MSFPDEMITKILAHTVRSQVPFHLQEFLESGKGIKSWPIKGLDVLLRLGLSSSQCEHYRDWLAIKVLLAPSEDVESCSSSRKRF